jgi:hypothetical protein
MLAYFSISFRLIGLMTNQRIDVVRKLQNVFKPTPISLKPRKKSGTAFNSKSVAHTYLELLPAPDDKRSACHLEARGTILDPAGR